MANGKKLCFFIATFVIAAFSFATMGMPAKKGLRTVSQADGSSIKVQLIGDEHCHIYLSEDGFPLVSENNCFYYAKADDSKTKFVSTGIRAKSPALRGDIDRSVLTNATRDSVAMVFTNMAKENRPLANGMRRASANLGDNNRFLYRTFPNRGKQKALIFLVEYPDVPFTLDDPLDYFTRMLNEPGFSTRGATGSANDFFRESSNGLFDPEFDVYGPVMMKNNRVYYGGDNETNAWQMVIEACDQLDGQIDFSEYDRDGDGQVDNIYVFFSGEGESSSGNPETVWPHASKIAEIDLLNKYIYDGKIINSYGVSNEMENGNPDGVGTFCHEFSHVMGLPDLYPTEYTDAFDPGEWSALAYGPYNNEGRTPPLYSAFERYCVGWIELEELPQTANVTLPPVGTNKAYAVKTTNPDEFYVLENRQQLSWDKYLPHHGMLVWHIDFDQAVWSRNAVNNNASHQRVDIVEADNTRTAESRTGDAFPGTAGVTSFTDDTTPSMMSWQGYRLSRPISGITETDDGFITFKVSGGYEDTPAPTSFQINGQPTSHKAVLQWAAVENADDYLVSVYREGTFLPTGKADMSTAGATTLTIDGLEPSTAYCCYVQTVKDKSVSYPSSLLSFVTAKPGFDDIVPIANKATDISGSGFTASWNVVADADGYIINVYTKGEGEPLYNTIDFTGGVDALPQGWTSSSKATYSLSGYAGASVPSLRMSNNGDVLQSAEYPDGIRSIKLWHRGNGSKTPANSIVIKGLVGGNWQQLTTLPICKDTGGRTDEYKGIPSGCTAIQIIYETVETGSLAIDDIVIGHGAEEVRVYADGFEDKSVGNVTSVRVDNLDPETAYYYIVKATQGKLKTLESDEIALITTATSSIGKIVTGSLTVTVSGSDIEANGTDANAAYSLIDIAGRKVASGHADSNGTIRTTAPGTGIYILQSGASTTKIIVK